MIQNGHYIEAGRCQGNKSVDLVTTYPTTMPATINSPPLSNISQMSPVVTNRIPLMPFQRPSYGYAAAPAAASPRMPLTLPKYSSGQTKSEGRRSANNRLKSKLHDQKCDSLDTIDQYGSRIRGTSSSDPVKDTLKKNIQKKLRMKMIKKGQLPPNPTVEELQMCGIQPVPVHYPVPYYYGPPSCYDVSGGNPIYMPPSSPYHQQPSFSYSSPPPPPPPSHQQYLSMIYQSRQHQPPHIQPYSPDYIYTERAYPQKIVPAPHSPKDYAEAQHQVAMQEIFDECSYASGTSSQLTLSPQPIPTTSTHSTVNLPPTNRMDKMLEVTMGEDSFNSMFDIEGLFSTATITTNPSHTGNLITSIQSDESVLIHDLDPYLLPNHDLPEPSFEAFFNDSI